MMAASSDFDTTVASAARALGAESSAGSDHPEVEALIGYVEGRLDEEHRDTVRRHLVECSECARQALGVKTFDLEAPEESDLFPSREESLADLAEFRRRIGREREPEISDGPAAAGRAPEARFPNRQGWRWAAAAAAALLALSGLGFWILGLQQLGGSDGDAYQKANPYVFDLIPDAQNPTREASSAREIPIPPGMDPLVARLNLGDQTPHAFYRAEILDSENRSVWKKAELSRLPAGNFVILVPRAALPPGTYRLKLFGGSGDQEEILATYTFRLL